MYILFAEYLANIINYQASKYKFVHQENLKQQIIGKNLQFINVHFKSIVYFKIYGIVNRF